MDLISREAVLEKQFTVYIKNMWHMTEDVRVVETADIKKLPSAFEGMTVGEVMKAVLGIEDEQIVEAKYLVSIYPKGNHYDTFIAIKREVWNSTYQKGGE